MIQRIPPGTALAGLFALAIGAVTAPAAHAAPAPRARAEFTRVGCEVSLPDPAFISSDANGRYVSAELGYDDGDWGMLRARADAIGPWEHYTFHCSNSTWWLQSDANGRYVSAELGYSGGDGGMLRARADVVGPWEKFALYRGAASGTWAIRSLENGRYVSAELRYDDGDAGMLRARNATIGPWEQFAIGAPS
ncbi:hypothetical protein [Actinomadura sp. NTSP31]|uniref:fascin domain-containing protein n=1 Tax=Actinomadura sp. NTSP31 TaxID=1735447 RepID=UPI0035C1ECE6